MNIAVLLVHGINPFGFRCNRRVSENNVNLNRNFDVDEKLFTTLNEGYQALKGWLEPPGPVTSLHRASLKRSLRLLRLLILRKVKAQSVIQAIGQGQYDSPHGLEFGGQAFEPQVTFLAHFFRQISEPYSDILHIDLHTGLGRKKALQILTGETPLTEAARRTLERLFDQAFNHKLFDFADGNTAGFYHTHGDIVSLLPKIWIESQKTVLGLTAEFGTLGNSIFAKLRSLNNLVLENQGFHNGFKTEALKTKVNENFRNFFFPPSASWRSNALAKADWLFKTILEKY